MEAIKVEGCVAKTLWKLADLFFSVNNTGFNVFLSLVMLVHHSL